MQNQPPTANVEIALRQLRENQQRRDFEQWLAKEDLRRRVLFQQEQLSLLKQQQALNEELRRRESERADQMLRIQQQLAEMQMATAAMQRRLLEAQVGQTEAERKLLGARAAITEQQRRLLKEREGLAALERRRLESGLATEELQRQSLQQTMELREKEAQYARYLRMAQQSGMVLQTLQGVINTLVKPQADIWMHQYINKRKSFIEQQVKLYNEIKKAVQRWQAVKTKTEEAKPTLYYSETTGKTYTVEVAKTPPQTAWNQRILPLSTAGNEFWLRVKDVITGGESVQTFAEYLKNSDTIFRMSGVELAAFIDAVLPRVEQIGTPEEKRRAAQLRALLQHVVVRNTELWNRLNTARTWTDPAAVDPQTKQPLYLHEVQAEALRFRDALLQYFSRGLVQRAMLLVAAIQTLDPEKEADKIMQYKAQLNELVKNAPEHIKQMTERIAALMAQQKPINSIIAELVGTPAAKEAATAARKGGSRRIELPLEYQQRPSTVKKTTTERETLAPVGQPAGLPGIGMEGSVGWLGSQQ